MAGRANIHDVKNADLWHVRLREARGAGLKACEFRELWGIRGGATWVAIKDSVSEIEPEVTDFSKPYEPGPLPAASVLTNTPAKKKYGSRGPYKKRKKQIMEKSHHDMQIIERPRETQFMIPEGSRPIFCLVVGFESKEAAFRAMGQL